jgi:hypothetical protein
VDTSTTKKRNLRLQVSRTFSCGPGVYPESDRNCARNLSGHKARLARKSGNFTAILSRLSRKYGSLDTSQTCEHPWPLTGTALLSNLALIRTYMQLCLFATLITICFPNDLCIFLHIHLQYACVAVTLLVYKAYSHILQPCELSLGRMVKTCPYRFLCTISFANSCLSIQCS